MRSGVFLLITLAIAACGMAPSGARVSPPGPLAPHGQAASAEDETSDEDDADEETGSSESAEIGDPSSAPAADACPRGMVVVDGSFCIDKYEAALVEVLADGTEKPYPHYLPVDGHAVRAVSEPGLYPQGYISEVQAQDACAASGKRLCSYPEWKTACMGPKKTAFPYGEARRSGVCHDGGKSAVVAVFGAKAVAASPVSALIAAANAPKRSRPAHVTTKRRVAQVTKVRPGKRDKQAAKKKPRDRLEATRKKKKKKNDKKAAARGARPSTRPSSVELNVWTQLNDARLGQVEGAISKTGDHPECANDWGVVDMVGNLHEWVATDPNTPRGTFAGGYYLDTAQNGDGCNYKTQAHAHDYHDYSTGFRCCAEAASED